MALDGIYAAVSGLRAASTRLNQRSHNLANVSTPGFTPRRVDLADARAGGVQTTGTSPMGAGPVVPTDHPLDLALDGGGFFVLNDGQGGRLYSRAGNFVLDDQGALVDPLGRSLSPSIQIPPEAAQVHVTAQGKVQALAADGSVHYEGRIQTASFGNPGGLESVGGNAFRETAASGPPVTDAPGTPGHGQVISGALQASGTDIAREMAGLVNDQRYFEANLKTVQTEDEMLGSILDVVS